MIMRSALKRLHKNPPVSRAAKTAAAQHNLAAACQESSY
jgi:hypothetical protein